LTKITNAFIIFLVNVANVYYICGYGERFNALELVMLDTKDAPEDVLFSHINGAHFCN